MTTQASRTAIEGNKLIALFMGATISDKGIVLLKEWHDNHKFCEVSDLKYHSSWDWLMPVVEKITRIPLPYKQDDGRQDTHWPRTFGMLDEWGNPMFRFNCGKLFTADTLIEATYKAIVDFIEWYNNQNK